MPLPPRKPGRPPTLDDVKKREVCALITAGCGIEGAAKYVGCAASTIRREAQRNAQFSEDLRRARLSAELGMLSAIREQARKNWRAGAWLLERMNPQRFARQDVRLVKPEMLAEFTSILAEVLKEESGDLELCRRVTQRLSRVTDEAQRIAWHEHHDPCPKPRRGEKAAAAEALRRADTRGQRLTKAFHPPVQQESTTASPPELTKTDNNAQQLP